MPTQKQGNHSQQQNNNQNVKVVVNVAQPKRKRAPRRAPAQVQPPTVVAPTIYSTPAVNIPHQSTYVPENVPAPPGFDTATTNRQSTLNSMHNSMSNINGYAQFVDAYTQHSMPHVGEMGVQTDIPAGPMSVDSVPTPPSSHSMSGTTSSSSSSSNGGGDQPLQSIRVPANHVPLPETPNTPLSSSSSVYGNTHINLANQTDGHVSESSLHDSVNQSHHEPHNPFHVPLAHPHNSGVADNYGGDAYSAAGNQAGSYDLSRVVTPYMEFQNLPQEDIQRIILQNRQLDRVNALNQRIAQRSGESSDSSVNQGGGIPSSSSSSPSSGPSNARRGHRQTRMTDYKKKK
jgi:hypothetical protein